MGLTRKIGQLLIVLLLATSVAQGAISRVQSVSANASSATLSSTTSGDAILIFAYNGASSTAVTLTTGYTSLATTGANSNAARVAWKISSGGETTTGTWTNATNIVALVYRGLDQTTPFTTNGNGLASSANTTSMSFAAFSTMTKPGQSWVAGVGGARSATAGMNGSTTSLTSRTNQTTVCGLDSGAAMSSFSTESFTYTTSGNRMSIAVEVIPAVTQSATNGFFKLIAK